MYRIRKSKDGKIQALSEKELEIQRMTKMLESQTADGYYYLLGILMFAGLILIIALLVQ